MFNLGKTKSLIGLDIGSSSVKAVELKKAKAGYELVSFGLEPLAQDTVVDGAIMDAPSVAEKIVSIFDSQKIKVKDVATSVSGHSVIVKRVSMPLMTEEELFDRVQAEASQHIPFDIADVNLSYQLLEATENQMDVLLVAVKKDKILNHTNVLAQAGKTPVVVDIDAFALQNSFEAELRAGSFAGRGPAERGRERDEHQHHPRLDAAVHARRFGRRQSVHRRAAEGTRPELRGRREAEDGRDARRRERRAAHGDPAIGFRHSDPRNSEDLRFLPRHGQRRKYPPDFCGAAARRASRACSTC